MRDGGPHSLKVISILPVVNLCQPVHLFFYYYFDVPERNERPILGGNFVSDGEEDFENNIVDLHVTIAFVKTWKMRL